MPGRDVFNSLSRSRIESTSSLEPAIFAQRRFGDVASFYHQEGYRRKPKSRDVVFVLRRTDAEAERYLSGIVGAVSDAQLGGVTVEPRTHHTGRS